MSQTPAEPEVITLDVHDSALGQGADTSTDTTTEETDNG